MRVTEGVERGTRDGREVRVRRDVLVRERRQKWEEWTYSVIQLAPIRLR